MKRTDGRTYGRTDGRTVVYHNTSRLTDGRIQIGMFCFSARTGYILVKRHVYPRAINRIERVGASCQVSIHLAKRCQRRRFFKKSTNQKQELSVVAMFVNGSERNQQSQQMTFHRCFLPSFGSFGQTVSEEKNLKNQKQESPVAAMSVNGSGRIEQSL